jgi:hypothetical protein
MARWIIGSEVGFRFHNHAGDDAVIRLADQLLPQECLGDSHGVAIIKRTRKGFSQIFM